MYSNNSDSIRDALCFLMDEEQGNRIAFIQYPQNFNNITKNDLYRNALLLLNEERFSRWQTQFVVSSHEHRPNPINFLPLPVGSCRWNFQA